MFSYFFGKLVPVGFFANQEGNFNLFAPGLLKRPKLHCFNDSFKAAGKRLDHQYSFILFKAYARSATNDSDIARNIHDKLCSIKSLFYASMIACAFNRVAGNIVHLKYC